MKRIFLIAALFALPATSSFAAINTEALVSGFQADGYTSIEVTQGLSQTKVEAIRANEKVEIIYDNETGTVLKSEVGTPEAGDDIRPGVSIRTRARDFVDGASSDDDSSDDDSSDDDNSGDDDSNSGSDDDGSDDNSGHGNNHDDDDDDGDDDRGDDDRGDDDRGDDDRGGDDRGSDDRGGDDRGGDDD